MKAVKSLRRMAAVLASSLASTLAFTLAGAGAAQAAANIVIVNLNAPGVGFNDPTPAAPIGGNPGTTLGEQRLIAFQHAAAIWGATLDSSVTIRVGAGFVPLACNAGGAVLGSAGPTEAWTDFPNAPRPSTWYVGALAAKLAGEDLTAPTDPHIIARFNSRLGLFPDCLPGSPFYVGLDNNAAGQIDLVAVLLHEMAHGLGFLSLTDDETGALFLGLPSEWDYHLVDNRNNTPWVALTDAQRASSAVNWRGLSWNGPNVNAAVPTVLAPRSNLDIGGANAGSARGDYYVGDASFGPALGTTPVSGQLMPVVDQANGAGLACTPLSAANALAVRNNVALVDRGACDFTLKARNVQAAGAIAMVVVDNAPGDVIGLSGDDPTITIPAVRITLSDGVAIKAALQQRSRSKSGVVATLAIDPSQLAGTDAQRRILMYTPSIYSPGSSVSHYTTEAKPNQLMEPSINSDLEHVVTPPRDLSFPLLQDLGW